MCAFLFVHRAFQFTPLIPPAEIAALVAELLLLVSLRLRQCGSAVFTVRFVLAAEVAFNGADGNPSSICDFGYRHSVLAAFVDFILLKFCHFHNPLHYLVVENGSF